MNTLLSEKLRELRKTKNVSQEKLADYLGISYQAVSKWENGITAPDIMLLPEIARYYGITVDELLQVEKFDEKAYFEECSMRSEELYRNGYRSEILSIWLDAHKKFPNNAEIKEMLMSIYFDTDKVKYQKEIVELGTELYNTQNDEIMDSYYKGQAIQQIARTYYESGNKEKAKEWVRKAHSIVHFQELLYMQTEDNEEWLVSDFRFANSWYFQHLFYMAMRLVACKVKLYGDDYTQKVNKAVADIYEIVYPDDDMGYEDLYRLCMLHLCVAEDEVMLGKDEAIVKNHLTRAVECAVKSVNVKAHNLTHPLVYGWPVAGAPEYNMQTVNECLHEFQSDTYKSYNKKTWFLELIKQLEKV